MLRKKILPMLLAGTMLLNTAACGPGETAEHTASKAGSGQAGDAAPAAQFDERVTIYVTGYVSSAEPDGRRSDPVSKYIEDSLNINLELSSAPEGDYATQLSAMIAANDLPDIFLFSDTTKQFSMLMESQNILCLEPYLEQYAPNTLADKNGAAMLEAYRGPANSPDGKVYMWGMCKGAWNDGTMPTCGHYIRWDLYKQAGYPEIDNYGDSLLDVIAQMVDLEPQTAGGLKTYGLGAWFGEGQDWGEWVFTYGLAPQEGANIITESARTLAISTADSTPVHANQLTDPQGYIWRAVQFYNKANQRGLLDPDSFTQKFDMYDQKMKAGQYVFNVPGWISASANREYAKTEDNVKTMISLPSIGSDQEDRFGNMVKGERAYGVSAMTEYPERCVALLDFLSTYDFSRTCWNGVEGMNWNMEDDVPVPTEAYLRTDVDQELIVATGADVYHHLCGYGNGSVDPKYNVAVDLHQFSKEAVMHTMNGTVQDFCAYYGQETQVEVYEAETPVTQGINLFSFAAPPGDMFNDVNALNAYVGKNIFKAVAAKDDAEFEKIRDEIIAGMQDFHVDELFTYFYNSALEQSDEIAKLVDMIQ